MPMPIFQVDAFADRPFRGNPAAVCLLEREADPVWMQNVAMEMNLAETAFVWPMAAEFGLRWFTPTVEVDLCGHATLASAHILWETGRLPQSVLAKFHTKSGLLTCSHAGERMEMDFPAEPAIETQTPAGLVAALGTTPLWVGRNRMDTIVLVESEQDLRQLSPDLAVLEKLPGRGVIVSAQAQTAGVDFVSRFFAPQSGVPEDPVTGSAHCCLAPFWSARLGKSEMVGYQASKRGGFVSVRLQGNRVMLGGKAVTVLRGELW